MQGPRRPAARHGAGRLLERRPHPDRDHKLAVSISLNSETLNIANGVVRSTVVCWFSIRAFRIDNHGRQKKKSQWVSSAALFEIRQLGHRARFEFYSQLCLGGLKTQMELARSDDSNALQLEQHSSDNLLPVLPFCPREQFIQAFKGRLHPDDLNLFCVVMLV